MFATWCPLPKPGQTLFVQRWSYEPDDASPVVKMFLPIHEPGWPEVGEGETLQIRRRYEWVEKHKSVITDQGYSCKVVKIAKQNNA